MIKTLSNILKQDKEKFKVPRKVQDIVPVRTIWPDGIFLVGKNKYSKMYRFEDINYAVASREDKESMFLEYSEILNSLDSGATTKITINNRRLNRLDFEEQILIGMKEDGLNELREEYNDMLLDKATGSNSIIQDKYVTISVNKKTVEDARVYFARVGADLISKFGRLGSACSELDAVSRLRIIHDFFRTGEETSFHFDLKDHMRKGHRFRDYISPDYFENGRDFFRIGDRYGRVLFLRDYASYIKDDMVAELTDINRNLMLSIDVIPVPTDEAVKEVEQRLRLPAVRDQLSLLRMRNLSPAFGFDSELRASQPAPPPKPVESRPAGRVSHGVIMEGMDMDIPVRFAKCCSPVPGDDIVGFITRGRGVSVHKAECVNALSGEKERRVAVAWADTEVGTFCASIKIVAYDHVGLLGEVTTFIGSLGVPIRNASTSVDRNKIATIRLVLEVRSREQMDSVIRQLQKRQDVVDVFRVTG